MDKLKIVKLKPTFSDERGIIMDVLSGNMKHVGIITSKQGAVRANHYHKLQWQYTYVLSGRVELTTKDLREKSPKVKKAIVPAGYLISIPPMIYHSYKALEDFSILTITTELRNTHRAYERDTFRIQL